MSNKEKKEIKKNERRSLRELSVEPTPYPSRTRSKSEKKGRKRKTPSAERNVGSDDSDRRRQQQQQEEKEVLNLSTEYVGLKRNLKHHQRELEKIETTSPQSAQTKRVGHILKNKINEEKRQIMDILIKRRRKLESLSGSGGASSSASNKSLTGEEVIAFEARLVHLIDERCSTLENELSNEATELERRLADTNKRLDELTQRLQLLHYEYDRRTAELTGRLTDVERRTNDDRLMTNSEQPSPSAAQQLINGLVNGLRTAWWICSLLWPWPWPTSHK